MLGKWHLGHFAPEHLPLSRGFDEFYGFYSGFQVIGLVWFGLIWFGGVGGGQFYSKTQFLLQLRLTPSPSSPTSSTSPPL
jgi:hypothetical protein